MAQTRRKTRKGRTAVAPRKRTAAKNLPRHCWPQPIEICNELLPVRETLGEFLVVADGAERQYDTATTWLRAIWDVRPKPSFTLIPLTPERLREKQAIGDYFFQTVLNEGVVIAAEN